VHVVGWMELKPLLETLSEVALRRDETSEKVIEKVRYVCGLRCPEWKLLIEDAVKVVGSKIKRDLHMFSGLMSVCTRSHSS